jgi:molybdenum cofactor cytidylyltransferase
VLLGDEPGIKAADIRTLTVAWDPGSADMARIRYQDRPGHPVLFGPAARHRAQELEGDALIWETLCQERFAAMEVAVNRLAPIDVDSPADLRRARHRETME